MKPPSCSVERAKINVDRTIETLEIGVNDLLAVRQMITLDNLPGFMPEGFGTRSDQKVHRIETVLHKDDLGKLDNLKDLKGRKFFLANAEGKEQINRLQSGNFLLENAYFDPSTMSKLVFTDLASGRFSPADIVELDTYNGMAYSIDGKPFGKELLFINYTHSPLNNEECNLALAVEILRDRPDIYFPMLKSKTPASQATLEDLREPCPDYTGEGSNKYTIAFVYQADGDTVERLIKHAEEHYQPYPFTRLREALMDLDLLGLREAGVFYEDAPSPPAL